MDEQQLKRELDRLNKKLKTLNQRMDGAYEMAINDQGRAMDRVQRQVDDVVEKKRQLVATFNEGR